MRSKFEIALEWCLFTSRWLLAPLYLGMILVLGAILVVFFRELAAEVANLRNMDGEQIILLALSLVDLSLTANLLLIVILRATKISSPRSMSAPTRIAPPGWGPWIFRV